MIATEPKTVEVIRVVAQANVLGLRRGEVADFPVNTFELMECLARDLVRQIDANGSEVVPEAPKKVGAYIGKRRCCGG